MLTLLLAGALGLSSPSQQTDTTFAVQPGSRLRLDNHQGSVRIRAAESSSIRVVARHSSRTRVSIRRNASVTRIEGEARGGGQTRIDYDITVPRSVSVMLDGYNCEVLVEGVENAVSIENVQGDIVVRGGSGSLALETVEGEIVVNDHRGRVRAESVNKGIRLNDVTGSIDAESVNGAIQLAGIRADTVSAESVNGNLRYQGEFRAAGRYTLSTHNGSIGMVVPSQTNATVTLATHSGNVETDFPVQLREALGRGRITFVLGSGAARVNLESFGGTIRLNRPNGPSR